METVQRYYQTPAHVIAAGVTLSIIDLLAVGLRLVLRKRQAQPLKMDDWLMIPATLLTIVIGIIMIYGAVEQSLGYTIYYPPDFTGDPFDFNTDQLRLTLKIQWVFALMLPLALGCIKMSFLFFYIRIFSLQKRSATNISLVILIIFVALWMVAFFFEALFECGTNFWAFWGTTNDLLDNCAQGMQAVLWLCITDFVADFAIIVIPIPLVWQLRVSTSRKLAIIGIFLLGAVSVASSLTRLVIMAKAVAIGYDSDAILVITEFLYWGLVECAVGILAACLPTLHSAVKKLSWPSLASFSSRSKPSRRTYVQSDESGIAVERTLEMAYTDKGSRSKGASNRELRLESDRLSDSTEAPPRTYVSSRGNESFQQEKVA